MKKAKRLLAVLLAAVMIFSAACVPSYAYKSATDNYRNPKQTRGQFYFDYDQACSYLCDVLDNLLADLNILIYCDDLNQMVKDAVGGAGFLIPNIFTANAWLNLDDHIADCGGVKGEVDLRSIDQLIPTLGGVFKTLDESATVDLADFLGVLGDIMDGEKGLKATGFDHTYRRHVNGGEGNKKDSEILEMLILWLTNQKSLFRHVIAGTFNWGSLLEGVITGLLEDLVPGATVSANDIQGFLRILLYRLLVDESATAIPAGEDVDSAVQKLVDMALITGTGTTAETGALSILGENFQPLMPSLAEQPGGAGLYGVEIQADRNGDGSLETHTMGFYQLVSNVIQALLDGMLAPMLGDVILDALDVEITEEFPYGDPAVMQDVMFNTIVGAVEGLMIQNGAPKPEYTDEENQYPVLKVNALLDWFFMPNGGLATLIKIDYSGFHIQDAFMSLLADVARLGINLLPGLGLFESSADLAYTADELNEVWFYDEGLNIVAATDETAVDQTYLTFETGEIIYPAAKQTVGNVEEITGYNYLDSNKVVNITDDSAADYVNPKLIRPNYVIDMDMVYACIIKMALNDMIDGCYFPEWTTDIPSVLAYGFAALALPVVPENNYYARLDAYHQASTSGIAGATIVDANNNVLDPIPYTITKTVGGVTVTVPKAALDIISSVGAVRLNGLLQIKDSKDELTTDTSLEQFAGEFLLWGFVTYMPALTGITDADTGDTFVGVPYYDAAQGKYITETRTWTSYVNDFIGQVYSDYSARTNKGESANWDAIYDLIDATIFTLLPKSWLPNLNGSFQLINELLLGNLIEFDLQGLLTVFSVNDSADAELALPVVTVLIRIIDRVLAAVFNDRGVFIPVNRTGVVTQNNVTNITTLEALLNCKDANGNASIDASLPTFIYNLFDYLSRYAISTVDASGNRNSDAALLAVALPLIVSTSYEKPADAVLTNKGITTYKVADLEDYIKTFEQNVNATVYKAGLDKETAEAAVRGRATAVKSSDGTVYEVRLSDNETLWGTYATLAEANTVIEDLSNCYVFEELVDEDAQTYTYTLYKRNIYIDGATAVDTTDEKGETTIYSDFRYATLVTRSEEVPFVAFDGDFRYFEFEDFSEGYRYENATGAIDDAKSYASSYRSYAQNDLPNAYATWLMYSVEARLAAAGLYDANGDGYIVNSTDDPDYVAPTVDANNVQTDDGNPVDAGNPGIPAAMYPFASSDSTAFPYFDGITGETITVYMGGNNDNSMTPAKFEQLQLALDYAAKPENDRVLSTIDTEKVVRLALNTDEFDITPHEDGTYNARSKQWETLTADQISSISTWCTNNGFALVTTTAEDGTTSYSITHKAFAFIDGNFALGTSGVSTTPVDATTYSNLRATKEPTLAQELQMQIYASYADYCEAIYANRRSLYNRMDYISYTHEVAEADRARKLDVTSLSWLRDLTKPDYYDEATQKRNRAYTGVVVNGEPQETKVFTSGSYLKFRKAYEFADKLINASTGTTLATGYTQAQVTQAFYGLMETWQNLVAFTGPADFVQLVNYMDMAKELIDYPDKDDPELGYKSGYDILVSTYNDANGVINDESIDCERQGEVDAMAAALYQAIRGLTYNTAPNILPSSDSINPVKVIETISLANHITGQVYGLTVGVGATLDLIEIVGMRLESGAGNTVTITPSGRGLGTGSYYSGRVQNQEKFRYFAVIYGDINGDTNIDGTDATAIEYYVKTESVEDLPSYKKEAADVNHDGDIDEFDSDMIYASTIFKAEISQGERSAEETVVA